MLLEFKSYTTIFQIKIAISKEPLVTPYFFKSRFETKTKICVLNMLIYSTLDTLN